MVLYPTSSIQKLAKVWPKLREPAGGGRIHATEGKKFCAYLKIHCGLILSFPVERPQDEGGGADLAAVAGADAAHHRVDDEVGHVLAEPPEKDYFMYLVPIASLPIKHKFQPKIPKNNLGRKMSRKYC